MEKKNETLKTIVAIVLLAGMLGMVYFMYFKPKAAPGGTEAAKNGMERQSPPAAASANDEGDEKPADVKPGSGAAGKKAADETTLGKIARGPFSPPFHRELSPQAYFSLQEYSDDQNRIPRHYESAINAGKFAESTIAREPDKSFAGSAYLSSIEDAPIPVELKNPFVPIVKKDDGILNRFSTGMDMSFQPSGSSGSSGTSDIWDWFVTPGLPNGGEFVPPSNGFSNGGNGAGTSTPFLDVDPNAPVVMGGPAKLLGIALSDKGSSALLEVGPAGDRTLIRVRTGQIMEGRFKVAEIAEDGIVLVDLNSGKTTDLKMGRKSRRFA